MSFFFARRTRIKSFIYNERIFDYNLYWDSEKFFQRLILFRFGTQQYDFVILKMLRRKKD